MNFTTLIETLETSGLDRGCIIYKSSSNMQKTLNYIAPSTFTVILNNSPFMDINQILFIEENKELYVYLEVLLGNNNRKYEIFPLTTIETMEVIT